MNRQHEREKAWREWHAGYAPEGFPSGSPAFDRGFNAAWDAMQSEIRCIVARLETESTDQPAFRLALSRLRELTKEQRP